MLAITSILFAIAAVFGLMNLTAILKSTSTNKGVVYTHGLFAAAGIVLLIVYALSADTTNVSTSIILFIIASLGGFLLFARDLMKKAGPKWLAVVHGLIAVASFVILLVAAFS